MAGSRSIVQRMEVRQSTDAVRFDPPHSRVQHGPGALNMAAIGPYCCGRGQRLLVIAGPCVIESRELSLSIASRLKAIAEELGLQLVFKASFDKANRTSGDSFRGVGVSEGLAVLAEVKKATGLPVTDRYPFARAGRRPRPRSAMCCKFPHFCADKRTC